MAHTQSAPVVVLTTSMPWLSALSANIRPARSLNLKVSPLACASAAIIVYSLHVSSLVMPYDGLIAGYIFVLNDQIFIYNISYDFTCSGSYV